MFASTCVSEMRPVLILSFALCDLELTDAMCREQLASGSQSNRRKLAGYGRRKSATTLTRRNRAILGVLWANRT